MTISPGTALLHQVEIARLERYLSRRRPDWVILVAPSLEMATIAHKQGAKVGLWLIDLEFPKNPNSFPLPEEHQKLIRTCDIVFSCFRELIPVYQGLGVGSVFLPPTIDTNLFFPMQREKCIDIVFVGSYYPARERGLRQVLYPLVERFGRQVHIYGKHWERNQRVWRATIHGFVEWRKIPLIYSSARIVLGNHHALVADLGGLNFRLFEALACRSFHVTDWSKGLGELFASGRELVIIDGNNDVVEVAERFLADEAACFGISTAGYNEFLANHTIEQRTSSIISSLGQK